MKAIKHVLLIHPEGNTLNNPSLKALVDFFSERHISISLICHQSHASIACQEGVKLYKYGTLFRKITTAAVNRLCSRTLSAAFFFLYALRIRDKIDLVIGVDREGLIYAEFFSIARRIPYVFFSFEIFYKNETSKRFKSLENRASRNVSHWFTQDYVRAGDLCSENGLSIRNCTLIPLASRGSAKSSSVRLRDSLGIPSAHNVAIFMGSISRWSMIEEVLASYQDWPTDWSLIVHDRYGQTRDTLSLFTQSNRFKSPKKIYISEIPADSVDDMSFILEGVDIGIAFYKATYHSRYTGTNLAHIGLASGKISTFLRHGVPIVSNEIGIYSDLIKQYGFGLCVEHPSDLPSCLKMCNLSAAPDAARSFFKNHLDFANYEEPLWSALLGLQT